MLCNDLNYTSSIRLITIRNQVRSVYHPVYGLLDIYKLSQLTIFFERFWNIF